MKFPRNSVFLFVSAFLVFPQFAFAVPQRAASTDGRNLLTFPTGTSKVLWREVTLTYEDMAKIFNDYDFNSDNVKRYTPAPITPEDKATILNENNDKKTAFFAIKLESPPVKPSPDGQFPYEDSAWIGYSAPQRKNIISVRKGGGVYPSTKYRNGQKTTVSVPSYVIECKDDITANCTNDPLRMGISIQVLEDEIYFAMDVPISILKEARVEITPPKIPPGTPSADLPLMTAAKSSRYVNSFLLKADVASAKLFKLVNRTTNEWTEYRWNDFQKKYGARDQYERAPSIPNPWYFVVYVAEGSADRETDMVSFLLPKLKLPLRTKDVDELFAAS